MAELSEENKEQKKQLIRDRIVDDLSVEELEREAERLRRSHLRVFLIVLSVLLVGTLIFFSVMYLNSKRLCTTYETVWQEPYDAVKGDFVSFSDGVLRVTKNGIRYLDSDGLIVWEMAVTLTDPVVAVRDGYAIIGDLGGRNAYQATAEGLTGTITVEGKITGVDISRYGVSAVMTASSDSSSVFFYDRTCKKLDIEVKNAINDENGMPLCFALSPDGQGLVFSMVNVAGGEVDDWVSFLNLDGSMTGTDKVTGAFRYEDALYPDVRYLNDTSVCAFGDGSFEFFSLADIDSPKLSASVPYEKELRSVLTGGGNVFAISKSENGNYLLTVYGPRGTERDSFEIDFEYETSISSGGYVLIHNEERCFIMDDDANVLYDGEFDGSTYQMVVTGTRTLLQIGDYGMREVKLK